YSCRFAFVPNERKSGRRVTNGPGGVKRRREIWLVVSSARGTRHTRIKIANALYPVAKSGSGSNKFCLAVLVGKRARLGATRVGRVRLTRSWRPASTLSL